MWMTVFRDFLVANEWKSEWDRKRRIRKRMKCGNLTNIRLTLELTKHNFQWFHGWVFGRFLWEKLWPTNASLCAGNCLIFFFVFLQNERSWKLLSFREPKLFLPVPSSMHAKQLITPNHAPNLLPSTPPLSCLFMYFASELLSHLPPFAIKRWRVAKTEAEHWKSFFFRGVSACGNNCKFKIDCFAKLTKHESVRWKAPLKSASRREGSRNDFIE